MLESAAVKLSPAKPTKHCMVAQEGGDIVAVAVARAVTPHNICRGISGSRRSSPRLEGRRKVCYYEKRSSVHTTEKQGKKKRKLDDGNQSPGAQPPIESCMKDVEESDRQGLDTVSPTENGEKDVGEGPRETDACPDAHYRVVKTLRDFNKHYLHFVQTSEEDEEIVKRGSKRPDLKAISKMLDEGTILYQQKRIGHLPGIDVGRHFFSRAEMVVLGLHSHWLNGIDYMGKSYSKLVEFKDYSFPLAICIVLSGMYEDDLDNADDIIYTGQGGHDLLGNKRQIRDQKMERGNLALKNSMLCDVPVRVVRGHESASSYCGKVYTYDGLYKGLR